MVNFFANYLLSSTNNDCFLQNSITVLETDDLRSIIEGRAICLRARWYFIRLIYRGKFEFADHSFYNFASKWHQFFRLLR